MGRIISSLASLEGRTFPHHQYFARQLGAGQLSLFNTLKAYSLIDPEVGYCQGLSFVAGVLLMHVGRSVEERLIRKCNIFCSTGCLTKYCPFSSSYIINN